MEARTRPTKTLGGIIAVTGDFGGHKCSTKDTKNAFQNNSSAQTVNNIYIAQIHTHKLSHPSPASSQDSWYYKRGKRATGVVKLRHLPASAACMKTCKGKARKIPKPEEKKKKEVLGVLAASLSSCRVVFRTQEEKRQQRCLFPSLGNVNDQTVT